MISDADLEEALLDSSQQPTTIYKSVELNSTSEEEEEELPEDHLEEPKELQEDLEVEEEDDHTLVEMVE
jgi:hypothetical protein